MNTKQKRPDHPGSNIYSIKENIEAMVSTAWVLSITCLWPSTHFSRKESIDAKKYIRRFIINEPDPYKAYMEFCQRILLAAKQLAHLPITSTPSEWFQSSNKIWNIQSLECYEEVQKIRLKKPLYKHEMKAFCEAILDMAEDPGYPNFQYWTGWFIPHLAFDECNLFLKWVARANYYFDNQTKNQEL